MWGRIKGYVIFGAVVLLLGGLLLGSYRIIEAKNREIGRLGRVADAFSSDLEISRTRLGQEVARSRVFELKVSEVERHAKDVEAWAKSLDLKVRRLESASVTGFAVRDSVIAALRDSLITVKDPVTGLDTVVVARAFSWADEWFRITGYVYRDSIRQSYEYRDTLRQAVERIPRRFLGIPYGSKGFEQVITLGNPNASVTYNQTIMFERGCRRKK